MSGTRETFGSLEINQKMYKVRFGVEECIGTQVEEKQGSQDCGP
jgi:hypothetical protein